MPEPKLDMLSQGNFDLGKSQGLRQAQEIGSVQGIKDQIDVTQQNADTVGGFLTGPANSNQAILVIAGAAIFGGLPEAQILAAGNDRAVQDKHRLQGKVAGLQAGLTDLQAAQQSAAGSGAGGGAGSFDIHGIPNVDPAGSGFSNG